MRWNIGWHKKDSGKLAARARGARKREMPAMDRIEGTAEEANIHARLVSSLLAGLASSSFL